MAITPNTPRLPERFVHVSNLYVDNLQRGTNCRPEGLTSPSRPTRITCSTADSIQLHAAPTDKQFVGCGGPHNDATRQAARAELWPRWAARHAWNISTF